MDIHSYIPTEDDIAAYNEDQAKRDTERKAKLPKPVRQPITIHIGRPDGPQRAELIDACDVFADMFAVRKLPRSRDYNITHVPTGLSVIDSVSPKAKAVECVMVLLEGGVEIWKFGVFGGGVTQENYDGSKRYRDKARHIAHPENWNEDGTRVR